MPDRQMTPEQLERLIDVARDSVTVINDQLEKLANGKRPSLVVRDNIERNVKHLEGVIAITEVIETGANVTDLEEAIVAGNAKLNEDIWYSNLTESEQKMLAQEEARRKRIEEEQKRRQEREEEMARHHEEMKKRYEEKIQQMKQTQEQNEETEEVTEE
jgi:hypothetical protein